MSQLMPIEPEYVYVTIPAEYICVYHRILAMLADYGIEMLQDCKANCTERNSGVIECFNMFNAAVACRKLGKTKEANVIITYIKAKINSIYQSKDNSTSFVFPVDETGQLKAFVSCGERPIFEINPDDMVLYEHRLNNGFKEHFHLGKEDESKDEDLTSSPVEEQGLSITLVPTYELIEGHIRPCAEIEVKYDNEEIDIEDTTYQYYFDDIAVKRFNDVTNLATGEHNFKVVVTYKGITKIANKDKYYEATNR